jgi:hypothetical protein
MKRAFGPSRFAGITQGFALGWDEGAPLALGFAFSVSAWICVLRWRLDLRSPLALGFAFAVALGFALAIGAWICWRLDLRLGGLGGEPDVHGGPGAGGGGYFYSASVALYDFAGDVEAEAVS